MKILVCGAGKLPILPKLLEKELELIHIDNNDNIHDIATYAKNNNIDVIINNDINVPTCICPTHILSNMKLDKISLLPTIHDSILYTHNSPIYIPKHNRHNKHNIHNKRK